MIYLIVWTVPSSPESQVMLVDKFEDLAGKVNSLNGKGATIKVYESKEIKFKITYTDKEEKTIRKIPNIEII